MIRSNSIPEWPDQVKLEKGHIFDAVLQATHTINETSHALLREIDGQKSIRQIAETVCQRYGWPIEAVEPDLVELVHQLNQGYVLNVKRPKSWGTFLKDAGIAILYFLRTLEGSAWDHKHRWPLDAERSVGKNLWNVAQGVSRSLGLFLLILSIIVGFIFEGLDITSGLLAGSLFFLTLLGGFILHEWGHTMGFALKAPPGEQAFFATRLGAMQVVKRRLMPHQEIVISLMGPMLPTIAAIASLALSWLLPLADEGQVLLWMVTGSLGIHLFSLIPPSEDAKRILEAITLSKAMKKAPFLHSNRKDVTHEKN